MPGITVDANGRGGIDLNISTPAHNISFALAPDQALSLASRIMGQLGAVSLVNNPDGTWTAQ